ncbi:hypothetical protein CEXT_699231 [Caerostris extrusa]|uniref:Uncharacterized protein n=1 Tax=Caerostris extrusa TaxID=172846 RepID=A0AAV4QL27_CAEEX|nr:hypothetical protein CEXT_699231 [Caerostris extrusa]
MFTREPYLVACETGRIPHPGCFRESPPNRYSHPSTPLALQQVSVRSSGPAEEVPEEVESPSPGGKKVYFLPSGEAFSHSQRTIDPLQLNDHQPFLTPLLSLCK